MGQGAVQDMQHSTAVSYHQQQHQQQQQGQPQLQPQQENDQLQTPTGSAAWPTSEGIQQPESPSDVIVVLRSSSQLSDTKAPLLQLSPPVKPLLVGKPLSQCCAGWHELRMLLLLALPTVVCTAVQQVIIVASQMFSGHIGTDEMAAAALSNTWWNLMWYVLLGVSTALDTLGSQAVGAGDKSGLVVWTISAAFVLTFINIPMAAGLWYADKVAQHFFGQGPEVVLLVQQFSRRLLPGLWPMTMAQLLQKYLQTQGMVVPPAITSGLSILVNIAASWLGAEVLGLQGVALAATATRVLLLLFMIVAVAMCESRPGRVCCAWWKCETWKLAGVRVRAALRSNILWTYLALGIPGGLMLGLECASFEVTTAFAGYLGPAEVAAHAGVFATTSLCYIALPFALATAATIRVGNLLGAGRARLAAVASRVVVCLGGGFMAVCGLLIYFGRHQLGEMFTAGDAEVLTAVALIAPLGAAYQVFDGILGTSQGVLRGLGRQAQLMILNMVTFWGVGVPTGYYLTFKAGWGLRGLWAGMSLGGFLAASVSLVLMLMVDWGREVELAQEKRALPQSDSSSSISTSEAEAAQREPLLQDVSVEVDEAV